LGGRLLLRLNIDEKPIVDKSCEGKMKRTVDRELKDLKSLRRKQCAWHSLSQNCPMGHGEWKVESAVWEA